MLSVVPCNNCLVLGVCKAEYEKYKSMSDSFLLRLYTRCSTARNYSTDIYKINSDLAADPILEFFKTYNGG